jgi:hypothetical protein
MIESAVVAHLSIAAYAIWFAVTWIVMSALAMIAIRKKRWINRAYRLARESDLTLPPRLEGRVAKRLRNEWLASWFLGPLIIGPENIAVVNVGLRNASFWTAWFPRLAMLLPTLLVVVSFGGVIVARWNPPGPTRVSHLQRISLRDAFTPTESFTLLVGVGATIAVVSWGLLQLHSPFRWWVLDFAAFALAAVLWWRLEIAVLQYPSTASDVMELRWDDVFRFRRVRSLAIGAAWLPPFVIFLLDWFIDQQLTHAPGGSVLPMYVPLVALVVVYLIFKQGRQLWRLDGVG